jgi:hypothetical protein
MASLPDAAAPADSDTEVTPAMVEVGEQSWILWNEDADFSTERLVTSIYRAMREVARKERGQGKEPGPCAQPRE